MPWSDSPPSCDHLIADLADQGFAGPFSVADGRPVHAAGGSDAQELAFVLANAVAYFARSKSKAARLDNARRFIFFRLAADQDKFLTIAKFRASGTFGARRAGLRACTTSSVATAETAWRMMTHATPTERTVDDYRRLTLPPLAARCGHGASLQRGAWDSPTSSRRRSRPQHETILIEEANLHRVADPAAGCGAIEASPVRSATTAGRCSRRSSVRAVPPRPSRSGLIQSEACQGAGEREANVAQAEGPLIGTSNFPIWPETARVIPTVRDAAPVRRQASLSSYFHASASPSRSNDCATEATGTSPAMVSAPKCSSLASGAPQTSRHVRASPGACSSQAASKPWKEVATL